jgi:hypothetical protein
MVAAGIKLMALDASPESLGSGFPTSFNVLKLEMPMDITFDDYVEVNVMQLKSLYGEDIRLSQETQPIGGLEAAKLEYQAEMNDLLGQTHTVTYQQYLMLDGRTQYVLTLAATEDQIGQNEELFSRVAQSFELIE